MQDALKYDEFAKQPQLHSGVPGQGGERGAMFHGQGARDGTVVKHEALRYFQLVEHAVRHALRDVDAPLVLAGIAYLLPIYRATNTYPQLIADEIAINPGDLRLDELHAQAWSRVVPLFGQACTAALDRYQVVRAAAPARATSYLRTIIPAAYAGRVDTLLLASGQQQWGSFEPASGVLAMHEQAGPRGTELYDLAAAQTIRHSGTVFTVDQPHMPDLAPIAAILRF